MKVYRFDQEVGKEIGVYGSRELVMSKILMSEEGVPIHHVGCMHIGPGGVVGKHRAESDQLFMVVSGEGWAQSEKGPAIRIEAGQAVLWKKEEWHESGSELGMTVIVVEGQHLSPDMPDAEVLSYL